MGARRPRATTRPRVALLSRARVGAALDSLPLHRSLWQHWVEPAPLLTWPGWIELGVHQSTQSFFTRFPDRGSTAHGRGDKCQVCPTTHPRSFYLPSTFHLCGTIATRVFPPEAPGLPLTCVYGPAKAGAGWAVLGIIAVGRIVAHMTAECLGW
jgi:hypothetical protein